MRHIMILILILFVCVALRADADDRYNKQCGGIAENLLARADAVLETQEGSQIKVSVEIISPTLRLVTLTIKLQFGNELEVNEAFYLIRQADHRYFSNNIHLIGSNLIVSRNSGYNHLDTEKSLGLVVEEAIGELAGILQAAVIIKPALELKGDINKKPPAVNNGNKIKPIASKSAPIIIKETTRAAKGDQGAVIVLLAEIGSNYGACAFRSIVMQVTTSGVPQDKIDALVDWFSNPHRGLWEQVEINNQKNALKSGTLEIIFSFSSYRIFHSEDIPPFIEKMIGDAVDCLELEIVKDEQKEKKTPPPRDKKTKHAGNQKTGNGTVRDSPVFFFPLNIRVNPRGYPRISASVIAFPIRSSAKT